MILIDNYDSFTYNIVQYLMELGVTPRVFKNDEVSVEDLKKIDLLRDFIEKKEAQQAAGRVSNTDNPDGLVNGTIETNLGLFRAYMTLYLRNHVFVNQDLTLMVRSLAPNSNGLPLEVYCFSSNKEWVSYESIQAEIMEHYVAIMPRFGLYPFQNPSGRESIAAALLEAGKDISTLVGTPVGIVRGEDKVGETVVSSGIKTGGDA